MTVKRHSEWYIRDGNVWLRTEDTMFRVHRTVLMKGQFWRDYFEPPQSDRSVTVEDDDLIAEAHYATKEGYSEANPLPLERSADEFSLLLSALYPKLPLTEYSLPELKILFELARFYFFEHLKSYICNRMKTMDMPALDMLTFAINGDDLEWELEAYVRLSTTATPMDYSVILKVFEASGSHMRSRDAKSILHLRDVIRSFLSKQAFQGYADVRPCLRAQKCSVHGAARTELASALTCIYPDTSTDDVTLYALVMKALVRRNEHVDWACEYCRTILKEYIEDVMDLPELRKLCKQCVPWLRDVTIAEDRAVLKSARLYPLVR